MFDFVRYNLNIEKYITTAMIPSTSTIRELYNHIQVLENDNKAG